MPNIDGIPTNVLNDIPDMRDRAYEPQLVQLQSTIAPPEVVDILNQGHEGACTGFGLAAVINLLNQRRNSNTRVSARMLYEMARKFDRWPGEHYSGSSCRGAIKGWYSMGVCNDDLAPYEVGDERFRLTAEMAWDARSNTIGAYYRVKPNIVDMHAAMNEVGAIYASANVHEGWQSGNIQDGAIVQSQNMLGGHAFAIVGYDKTGFIVQNSWGNTWGDNGLAHWSYEDWKDNVKDAWVIRLALPTPQLWGRSHESGESGMAGFGSTGPRREEIAGHFIHVDDGQFHDEGKYWSTFDDVSETVSTMSQSPNYDHLLFYAHGGLNDTNASAKRIVAMKGVFKANRIYPFHFMYDTGILEEIKDVLLGKRKSTEERVGGFADFTDWLLERSTRRPGRALWREMKSDATDSFSDSARPGSRTLKAFLEAFAAAAATPKIHLVGHSTGAVLLAHLLKSLGTYSATLRIGSVSLLAPAATLDLFESHFRPLVESADAKFGIDALNIYNLNEKLEKGDQVAAVYRKSLLYLVSNAFEEDIGAPILGMQKFSMDLAPSNRLSLIYSDGDVDGNFRTASTSHGGFDNDPYTMNDILRQVLGGEPTRSFTAADLDY
ncbi:MAG: C1 family peptidase [Gammaproteobacteria bacterium]|nr:C1 family peptidase [Gammaproteobacteria bacterium]